MAKQDCMYVYIYSYGTQGILVYVFSMHINIYYDLSKCAAYLNGFPENLENHFANQPLHLS